MYALMVNKCNGKGWILMDASVYQFHNNEWSAERDYDLMVTFWGKDNVKLFKEIEVGTVAN